MMTRDINQRLHLTDEESETQRGTMTSLRSHRNILYVKIMTVDNVKLTLLAIFHITSLLYNIFCRFLCIIHTSASHHVAFQMWLRMERKWKRPASNLNWLWSGPHINPSRLSEKLCSCLSVFCLWDRENATSWSSSLTLLLPYSLWSPKAQLNSPGYPVSTYVLCSKLNLCFLLPNLLLPFSPLLLFMAPLRLNIVMMSLVLSPSSLPKYDGSILPLCLINQFPGSVGSVRSLCPCPS